MRSGLCQNRGRIGKILCNFPAENLFFFSVLRESQRNRRKCIQRSCLHFLRFLWLSRSTEKKVVWDRENAWNLDKILPRFWNSFTWIEDNIFLRDLTFLHLLRIFLEEKSRSGLLDGPFKSHNNVPYFLRFVFLFHEHLSCMLFKYNDRL